MVAAAGVGWGLLIGDDSWPAPTRALPGLLLPAGAVLWSHHTSLRATDPAAWVAGDKPGWQFPAYTLLTIAGFALAGILILQAGPTWLGLTLTIGPALFLGPTSSFATCPPSSTTCRRWPWRTT